MAKRILTVDDSRGIRMLVKKALKPLGFDVSEAGDGNQALQSMREEKPNLVLLDVNMPVMGGIEMLKEVRKDPDLQAIPVIMLTTEREESLKDVEGLYTTLILKPFKAPVVLSKVRQILNV